MWGKINEIKKKAVDGLNTATQMASQMAKDIILENIDDGLPDKGKNNPDEEFRPNPELQTIPDIASTNQSSSKGKKKKKKNKGNTDEEHADDTTKEGTESLEKAN